MFRAAKLFSQNVRFFLTEPRRSPAAAGLPRPGGRLGSTQGLELSPWSVFPHGSGRYPYSARTGRRPPGSCPAGPPRGGATPSWSQRGPVRRAPSTTSASDRTPGGSCTNPLAAGKPAARHIGCSSVRFWFHERQIPRKGLDPGGCDPFDEETSRARREASTSCRRATVTACIRTHSGSAPCLSGSGEHAVVGRIRKRMQRRERTQR